MIQAPISVTGNKVTLTADSYNLMAKSIRELTVELEGVNQQIAWFNPKDAIEFLLRG